MFDVGGLRLKVKYWNQLINIFGGENNDIYTPCMCAIIEYIEH